MCVTNPPDGRGSDSSWSPQPMLTSMHWSDGYGESGQSPLRPTVAFGAGSTKCCAYGQTTVGQTGRDSTSWRRSRPDVRHRGPRRSRARRFARSHFLELPPRAHPLQGHSSLTPPDSLIAARATCAFERSPRMTSPQNPPTSFATRKLRWADDVPMKDPLRTSVDRGGPDSPICPAARQAVSRARPSTEFRRA